MAFRFQKSIKILPGVRLNISKTGVSCTVGTRGASVTARDGNLTGNVGIPGTGLSYRKRLKFPLSKTATPNTEPVSESSQRPSHRPHWLLILIILAIGVYIGLSMR
jgi:hypothetical protein